MKVALVNLCQIIDYVNKFSYGEEMAWLSENKIEYVDYCSHKATAAELLDGFHQAVADPTVDLVWFVIGGTTMIQFLDKIDWDLVKKTNKKYYGLSDFTHFVMKAVPMGVTCYYGQGLNKVKTYFPDAEKQKFLIDFLTSGKIADNQTLHAPTIGGHVCVTTFMVQQLRIDLSKKHLFIEYHNIPGETYYELDYFIYQLKTVISHNLPLSIILGHSLFYDKNFQVVEPEKINQEFISVLGDLKLPISYIDHFCNIIRMV